jgi:hypothetical protein
VECVGDFGQLVPLLAGFGKAGKVGREHLGADGVVGQDEGNLLEEGSWFVGAGGQLALQVCDAEGPLER